MSPSSYIILCTMCLVTTDLCNSAEEKERGQRYMGWSSMLGGLNFKDMHQSHGYAFGSLEEHDGCIDNIVGSQEKDNKKFLVWCLQHLKEHTFNLNIFCDSISLSFY